MISSELVEFWKPTTWTLFILVICTIYSVQFHQNWIFVTNREYFDKFLSLDKLQKESLGANLPKHDKFRIIKSSLLTRPCCWTPTWVVDMSSHRCWVFMLLLLELLTGRVSPLMNMRLYFVIGFNEIVLVGLFLLFDEIYQNDTNSYRKLLVKIWI